MRREASNFDTFFDVINVDGAARSERVCPSAALRGKNKLTLALILQTDNTTSWSTQWNLLLRW